MPFRPASRGRLAIALAVSLVLHSGLLLTCVLVRGQPQDETTQIDTRVDIDSRQLSLITLPPPRGKGHEEEQGFDNVRVEQTPATPFHNDDEPGPSVVQRGGLSEGHHDNTGSGGGPGKGDGPSFFRVPVAAKRIVFALDRSLSMGLDGCFTRAKSELIRCLHTLPPGTGFQVILYNRSAQPIPENATRLLNVDTETLGIVERVLADTIPEGGTDHDKAFESSLAFDPEMIFLVTDADDLTEQSLRHITRVNRNRVVIHTIDVSRQLNAGGMLAELAHENGGLHVHAP